MIWTKFALIDHSPSCPYLPLTFWPSKSSVSISPVSPLYWQSCRLPPVLHEWFIEMFPETEAWFTARLRYTRSSAVMSMVGYVLGYVLSPSNVLRALDLLSPDTLSSIMLTSSLFYTKSGRSTWRKPFIWRRNRRSLTCWFQLSLWQGSNVWKARGGTIPIDS